MFPAGSSLIDPSRWSAIGDTSDAGENAPPAGCSTTLIVPVVTSTNAVAVSPRAFDAT